MSQPRRIAVLLAAATFTLFLPVAWFSFVVYDDGLYVTDNPTVQAGVTWVGVKWAFTTMAASNWHPLTWLSHMIDCGVFGLKPAGPHLVNRQIETGAIASHMSDLWLQPREPPDGVGGAATRARL